MRILAVAPDRRVALIRPAAARCLHEQVGRGTQVVLHLALRLEQLVGPEHLQGHPEAVEPAFGPGLLEGRPQDLVQDPVVIGRLIERRTAMRQQLGELLVPAMARCVGVAQHRARHRHGLHLGLALRRVAAWAAGPRCRRPDGSGWLP